MTDDYEALANANEPEEENEPEPLSDTAAALYMDILMKTATTLRKEGYMAADALRAAEKALREKMPRAPKLTDRTLAKLAVPLMRIKKPPSDPKVIAAVAKAPVRIEATSLGDLLKGLVK